MLVYQDTEKNIKVTYDRNWRELTFFRGSRIVKNVPCEEYEIEDAVENLLWEVDTNVK